jgi:hypothetical protein
MRGYAWPGWGGAPWRVRCRRQVSSWQDRTDWLVLCLQMLVLCSLHTTVLLLMMVASEPSAGASEARVTEGHPSFERTSGMMQE